MKVKLRQVAFTFHHPLGGGDWEQFIVLAGLLHGKLSLSFTIGGEAHENLPATIVDAIREGLVYVERNVKVTDLREMDPEEPE